MPVLKLDGDAKGAVKAHSDLDSAVTKSKQGYQQLTLTADQLREQLKKAMDEKPIDTYVRKCEELAKKLVEGKINANQYTEQTQRLADAMHKAGEGGKQVTESHGAAFGGQAIGELASYAAGMFTIGKAIEIVTEAIREQSEEKKKAAENVEGGLNGTQSIVRAAHGSQAAADAGFAYGRRLMAQGLIPVTQQDQAWGAAAGMMQAGATSSDKNFMAEAAEKRYIDAGSIGGMAANIARFQQAFKGKAGSFQDVAKEFIASSADTLNLTTPEDSGQQMSDIAEDAVKAGMSPTEAIALYTFYVRQTKSARKGASATREHIEKHKKLTGDDAAIYAKELSTVQGAPKADLPDLLAGDPRLGAGRSDEAAKGAADAAAEDKFASTQSLANTVWQARRKRAIDAGGINPYIEGANRNVVGAGISNNTVIGREFMEGFPNVGRGSEASKQIERQLGIPEGYWERQEQLQERQARALENIDNKTRSAPAPAGRPEK